MYPSVPDHEKYTDGHLGHISGATGLPQMSSRQAYPPPYISSASARSRNIGTPWSTGLCHCCDDLANCFVTCLCPCITFGQISHIVNKGSRTCATSGAIYAMFAITGFTCFYSCFYRSKLRGQYDLEEAPFADCLVHFCCETCALCQEYRELKYRGFDMGIGWEANMERQTRGVMAAPMVTPGMTR